VSAKNIYHDAVVKALTEDGWTITDDPLRLEYGDRNLYVDLGAERTTLGAEKSGRKIAVEIQSFLGRSELRDLEEALGQYKLYQIVLAETQPERQIYMAVPLRFYEGLFSEELGQLVVSRLGVRLVVFDHELERVIKWIDSTNTD
jgi:hypothetical protein